MVYVHKYLRHVTNGVNNNWASNNATNVNHAVFHRFFKETNALHKDQIVHATNKWIHRQINARTVQLDNFPLQMVCAHQYHRHVTNVVNNNWASNNATNANHAVLDWFFKETNAHNQDQIVHATNK